MEILMIIATLIAGIASWTLMEYLLHRFLGHTPRKYLVRTRFYKEHSKHHYIKNYFAKTLDKVLTLLAIGPLSYFIAQNIVSPLYATVFTLGFVGMYCCYEIVHRRMHVVPPPHSYAAKMRAHHFYHHDIDESMNHGVTVAIWDRVFGTYVKPEADFLYSSNGFNKIFGRK